jgi:hypothetical protein
MREIFLQYAKRGAMSKKELAKVLNLSERAISDMVRAGKLKAIPNLGHHKFDPMVMIDTFCPDQGQKPSRSLTIEKHKTGAKPGGFRKCL